jgi:hypothetical protein
LFTHENKTDVNSSVADPHRKKADADPGKNLKADPDSCPFQVKV